MLIRRQDTVLFAHEIIKGDDRVRRISGTDEMDFASVTETEIARIGGYEFILEGRGAVPDDSRRLTGGGDVLSNLALLAEGAVRPLLVMTRDGCGVGNIH